MYLHKRVCQNHVIDQDKRLSGTQDGNINMRKKFHHSGALTVKIATIFLQTLVPWVGARTPTP
jgi:hypothetical protein